MPILRNGITQCDQNQADIQTLEIEKTSQTTGILHLYANASTGDDSKDGSSIANAVKTLQRLLVLTPYLIRHWVVWHIDGVFEDPGTMYLAKDIAPLVGDVIEGLIIDGGDSYTVVVGPFTADINSVSSIGDSGQTWTVNTYQGYFVEVTSGPAINEVRMIHSNTATTIIPVKNFSVDPGVGATFRIVKPATVIKSTGAWQSFYASGTGTGRIYYQRITFEGSNMNVGSSGGNLSYMTITHCVFEAIKRVAFYGTALVAQPTYRDPDDPTTVISYSVAGLGVRGCEILLHGLAGGGFAENGIRVSYVYEIRANNTLIGYSGQGSFINKISAYKTGRQNNAGSQFVNNAGYATTIIDGSDVDGVICQHSQLKFGDGVTISNNTDNGIRASNSHIEFTGVIAGTGNGKYGVHADKNSLVEITNGSTPTLTGTSGNTSTDGVGANNTWVQIDAGTYINDTAEFTNFNEG